MLIDTSSCYNEVVTTPWVEKQRANAKYSSKASNFCLVRLSFRNNSSLQSRSLNLNPLYLMIPATLSCSYAFMLPVATPPNAIVYTASGMSTSVMVSVIGRTTQ